MQVKHHHITTQLVVPPALAAKPLREEMSVIHAYHPPALFYTSFLNHAQIESRASKEISQHGTAVKWAIIREGREEKKAEMWFAVHAKSTMRATPKSFPRISSFISLYIALLVGLRTYAHV